MRATELRIGNLVEISNAYTHRPKGYETAYIHAISVDNCIIHWDREFFTCLYGPFIDSKEPHINAIPLTKEWLIKFGFTKLQTSYWELFRYFRIAETQDKDFYYTEIFDGLKVKYVHQLQNLYFALTGSELELK